MRECKRHPNWIVGRTEQWLPVASMPGGGVRRDLFGWMDLLLLRPSMDIIGIEAVGIQACAMTDRSRHLEKLRATDLSHLIAMWLDAPARGAELWAWRKLKSKRGGKAVKWAYEVTDLRDAI